MDLLFFSLRSGTLVKAKCERSSHQFFKDTHKENTPSSKTEMLSKSLNMYIWVVGTLNQLSARSSYTQINFFKEGALSGKSPFFLIGPLSTPHSICLNIAF